VIAPTFAPTPDPQQRDVLGRDLFTSYEVSDGRYEDVDLHTERTRVRGTSTQDLHTVDGIDNAVRAVIHRLKTVRGELADLGHPDYGSRHHELIGQPNNDHNRSLVKLYILQALAMEPRIEKIHKAVLVAQPQRDTVAIELTLSFIGRPVPTDLVIPFNFEGRQ